MGKKVTKSTPLKQTWTRLPKPLQFQVKAKDFFVRHGAMSSSVGTVIAARKLGEKVEIRVKYRSGKTVEDSINTFTKTRRS